MFNSRSGSHITGVLILLSAAVYSGMYWLTDAVSEHFKYSFSTSWVFIPAGVRMLLSLVLLAEGSLGVVLGTLWIDYGLHHSWDHVYNGITALIAGGSAYLSTLISQRLLHLQPDLSQLNAFKLLGIAAIFSLVSPLMHQIWYLWLGKTAHFLDSTAMMAIGDFLGTLIVLGGVQTLWRWFKSKA
jgi:hypothetical protein